MKWKNSTVTIEDVAREAGVSLSTVSRVLNNKPDVSEATKTRIRQVMERIGYSGHRFASNLAGGLSRTIALFLPISESGIRQLILDFVLGASKSAESYDFLINLSTNAMTEIEIHNTIQNSQIDGAILMRTKISDARIDVLQNIGLPFVMIGRCKDTAGLWYVDLDFQRSIEIALEHFLELGHTHIGFITYGKGLWEEGYTYVRLTNGAFKEVCKKSGISGFMVSSEGNAQAIREATERILTEAPETTAILTVYGEFVPSIELALMKHGMRIPSDISIIAITEDKTAHQMSPPLTSVTFPSEKMGALAAKILIERILLKSAYDISPKQVLINPVLVNRKSTTRLLVK
ncbi:MAG: LacI family DNA-binding transcriptional regulator [Spirochaetia bacterium]|nr:LacI family DNA-binding transcriptional regulator [Spirochaetia bacterium]